jgi:hypothetical protein
MPDPALRPGWDQGEDALPEAFQLRRFVAQRPQEDPPRARGHQCGQPQLRGQALQALAEAVRGGVVGGGRAAGFEPRVAFGSDDYNVAMLPRLALAYPRPGLDRVALVAPPVRRIVAARLAASYRSAATASMLGVLQTTAQAFRRGKLW